MGSTEKKRFLKKHDKQDTVVFYEEIQQAQQNMKPLVTAKANPTANTHTHTHTHTHTSFSTSSSNTTLVDTNLDLGFVFLFESGCCCKSSLTPLRQQRVLWALEATEGLPLDN